MHGKARRIPNVSPWAQQFVGTEEIDAEATKVTLKPTLMERVRIRQSNDAEKARIARKSSWINGLSGWGAMLLSFVHWPVAHVSTVLWVIAVLLWALAFMQ